MLRFTALVLLSLGTCNAYNILAIFPNPTFARQKVYQPVMLKLAERGHNVTVITPYPVDGNPYNQIDISLMRKIWERTSLQRGTIQQNLRLYFNKMEAILDNILKLPSIKQLLNGADDQPFDAVICETMTLAPINAFARIFKAPLIAMYTMDMLPVEHALLGNVVHPILHPNPNFQFHGKLSFWERCLAVYLELFMDKIVYKGVQDELDEITEKHFGQRWSARELMQDVDLAIVTAHPALDNVRPVVPSTVQLGFLHIQPANDLNGLFTQRMLKPVIYVSFGPSARSTNIGPNTMKILRSVFKQLDQYVIFWQWQGKEDFFDIPHLHIWNWLPQQDLLAHEAVKLFITHGGQQSMEEAIDRAVPMLAIPFFDDQVVNAKKIEHLGIGRKLELNDLNENTLKDSILDVMNNSSYKEKIEKLRDVVRDTPMPPVETAVWWIEYTIRNKGAPHLRYRGVDLPFWEYYLLDVVAFFVVVALAISFIFMLILRNILKCFIRKQPKKESKKMK